MTFVIDDPKLFQWLQNVLAQGSGSFLTYIAKAALGSDSENATLMYPLLQQLQEKYPGYNSLN